MTTTPRESTFKLIDSSRSTVANVDATDSDLLSARSSAWSDFFHNKEPKPFGTSAKQWAIGEARMKEECGIFDIEDELKLRGVDLKEKNYTRNGSHYKVNQYD